MAASVYQVTVGERVLRVQLRRETDGVYVRLDDGPEKRADLASVHGVLYSLVLGERRSELLARVGDDAVSVVLGGLEYQAAVVDEAHARLASVAGARASTHARRELKAPMPGLLVRVLCRPGDAVEAGQPLVVLQAMKMENELALPRGGTVAQVKAQAGQTVDAGQVLVVVE
jgi:biotin carboxyl carrier protein